jgi:hypothetical protein
LLRPGNGRTACGLDDGLLLPGYRIAVFIRCRAANNPQLDMRGLTINDQTDNPAKSRIYFLLEKQILPSSNAA